MTQLVTEEHIKQTLERMLPAWFDPITEIRYERQLEDGRVFSSSTHKPNRMVVTFGGEKPVIPEERASYRQGFTPRAEVSEVKPAEFDGDEEDECDTVESRLDAVEKGLLALKQTMRENRKEDRETQRQFRNSDQSLRRMQADRIENLEKRQDKGSDYGEFIASVLFNHQRQLNEIQGIDAEPKLYGKFKIVMSEDLEMRKVAE